MNPLSRLSPLQQRSLVNTARLQKSEGEAVALPQDSAEVSQPQKSATRRLVKWSAATGLAVVAGSSLLGGIAYHANYAALQQKPTVQIVPQKLPVSQKETPKLSAQVKAAQTPTVASAKGGPMRVFVPPATLTQLSHEVQSTSQFKQLNAAAVTQASHEVGQQLAVLKVPDSKVLLDVSMPLPTSDRPFLHIGSLDLPSMGMRALQSESVPLAMDYTTQPIATGLQVQIKNLEAPPGTKGPGLLLGAVQVSLTSESGKIPVQGMLNLHMDLDGQASQEQMAKLKGVPGQESLVKHLQQRLQQGRQLKEKVGQQGLEGMLQDGFDQKLKFEAQVLTGKGPVARSTLYLWGVPDKTGDGRMDIQVTQVNDDTGIANLSLEMTSLENVGKTPDGLAAGQLHSQVKSALLKGMQENLGKVTQDLQRMARERAEKEFAQGGPRLEEVANIQLSKIYASGQNVKYETGNALAPLLSAKVGKVQVAQGGLLVDLATSAGGSGRADFTGHLDNLKPGQFGAAMDLSVLNGQLKKVDWSPTLAAVKQKAELRGLEFAKGGAPQISMQNGKPTVSFEVIVHANGLNATKGVTGVLSHATGGLDKGMGKLQKNLKKEAGGLGEVVGGVLRAPSFLLDKIVGGGKAVLDNTVGAVTETATRPTVHTHISVPLTFQTENGQLKIGLDGNSVEFKKAQSQTPFDLLDLLPTRLISNAIAGAVADAQGPEMVGKQLQQQGLNVDLQKGLGLAFDEVRVAKDGDLTLIMHTTQQTANWVGEHLPHPPK
ncbi:MAG: hypothetical protein KF760_01355 [Candidatus Eremiobacteraeota bacterium]|nr:hypothetical protein [Candidatus Eremiobacteraeota bacterium]MCW5869786.1 hypothetical protein [Candidatus Eremiobacteraeota bacterium]